MPQRVEGSIEIEVPVETVYGYWETGGAGDPRGGPTTTGGRNGAKLRSDVTCQRGSILAHRGWRELAFTSRAPATRGAGPRRDAATR
jgi:hypothetical protein